jgi:hypothetical protein
MDSGMLNRDKKFWMNSVIWRKLYRVVYDWEANFESPGRGA